MTGGEGMIQGNRKDVFKQCLFYFFVVKYKSPQKLPFNYFLNTQISGIDDIHKIMQALPLLQTRFHHPKRKLCLPSPALAATNLLFVSMDLSFLDQLKLRTGSVFGCGLFHLP